MDGTTIRVDERSEHTFGILGQRNAEALCDQPPARSNLDWGSDVADGTCSVEGREKPRDNPPPSLRSCAYCEAPIIGRRADAIYCSSQCATRGSWHKNKHKYMQHRRTYQELLQTARWLAWREEYRSRPAYKRRRTRQAIRSKYGLEWEEVVAIVEEQGGVCPLCGKGLELGTPSRWAIDHDHTTGAVRGVLDPGCNGRLGSVEDAECLRRALRYLGVALVPESRP